MPGKGAKARKAARDEAKRVESIQREKDYLANGGIKSCKTCWNCSRCPIDPNTIDMICWVYGRVNNA